MYVVGTKRDRKKHGMQGFTNSPNVDTFFFAMHAVFVAFAELQFGIANSHGVDDFSLGVDGR